MSGHPAGLPVSAAQTEIWLADRCEPESGRYNVPVALEFLGDLDVPALRLALLDLLARRPALAGRFDTEDGDLLFRPEPSAPLPLSVVRHSGSCHSDAMRQEAVRRRSGPWTRAARPCCARRC